MRLSGYIKRKHVLILICTVAVLASVFCAVFYLRGHQTSPMPPIFTLIAAHDVEGVHTALARNHDLVKAVDLDGSTPLDKALAAGNEELIDLFLDAGAELNARNNAGATPLFFALASRDKQAQVATMTKLLDRGADPNITLFDGTHLLHLLAEQCNATDPRLLLVLNRVPDHPAIRDSQGRTPADIADATGHHASATWLRSRIHD